MLRDGGDNALELFQAGVSLVSCDGFQFLCEENTYTTSWSRDCAVGCGSYSDLECCQEQHPDGEKLHARVFEASL